MSSAPRRAAKRRKATAGGPEPPRHRTRWEPRPGLRDTWPVTARTPRNSDPVPAPPATTACRRGGREPPERLETQHGAILRSRHLRARDLDGIDERPDVVRPWARVGVRVSPR